MTMAALDSALLGVYRPAAPLFVRGEGVHVYDDSGRGYLDFVSGIGVNALGYGHPALTDAARAALDTGLVHLSNLYRTAPAQELAERLVEHTFADAVFFCNSGAEANEAAFKFARRWARARGGEAKHEIVAARGGFHGRLFGALAATDRPGLQAPFTPLVPGIHIVDVFDEAALAAVLDRARTAAIIVEPVQGEGGVKPLPAALLAKLRELADAHDALLIFDEVQCGLGRTGRFMAHEHANVTPDLLTLAKPLAGGLPMGATLLSGPVAEAIQPGDHATTFGGGPMVAAVANAVVATIAAPGFLEAVAARGREAGEFFCRLSGRNARVVDVRGVGLMWGVELNEPAGPFVARALERGLLIATAGERVLRLLPPLVIDADTFAEGLGMLEEVLA